MNSELTKPPGAPDVDHVWEVTFALPEQVALGAATAASVAGACPLPSAPVSNVVAFGMGGSGIGHDVLAAIAGPLSPAPVLVAKDYEVPAFVGPSTLVFAASFSGNTEETVTAFTSALERGAQVVVVCGGGRLGALAADAGVPVVPLPRDIPHPRLAIGAMAVAPLIVLEAAGLLPGASEAVAATVEQLSRRRDQLAAGDLAGKVAGRIGRTIPLIYGGGAVGRAAALRWKCQVNENAKSPAFWSAHPELDHNELAGWGQMGDVTRQLITLVDLRHDFEHPQVGRRFAAVDAVMEEVVAGIVTVHAAGSGPLAQLFDLVLTGDVVALTLAAREGVDPGPIPVLEDLKVAIAPPVIDAVFLDVGGVLAVPEPDVLLPLVHAAGAVAATARDLARGHYAGVAAMDRKARRLGVTADWPGYFRALAGELPAPPEAADAVIDAVRRGYVDLAWTGEVPGAVDALRRLAATGVAIAIISNSNGTVEEQLLRTGVCQVGEGEGVRVALVLDSFVVGIEKPDPGIFRHALDALGVPAARAVHVGDTGWADVEGARAAGVEPLHLDPFGFCPTPDDHEHVADLDGVIAWVAARRPPAAT